MKKKLLVGLAMGLFVSGIAQIAIAIQIDWANSVSNVLNVENPSNALGKPDQMLADFSGISGIGDSSATYAGFGSGQNVMYNDADLAALLNVNPSILAQADFISFDRNGTPNVTYETSIWVFSDGNGNSLTVPYTYLTDPTGAVTAKGNVSNTAYASFFGFSAIYSGGDMAYLLFDIDGPNGNPSLDPFALGFIVTLMSKGDISTQGSPNTDVMGRMGTPVPEPSLMVLLGISVLSLAGLKRWWKE
jgi:hypothetical protein